jgi:hypothetical protein
VLGVNFGLKIEIMAGLTAVESDNNAFGAKYMLILKYILSYQLCIL